MQQCNGRNGGGAANMTRRGDSELESQVRRSAVHRSHLQHCEHCLLRWRADANLPRLPAGVLLASWRVLRVQGAGWFTAGDSTEMMLGARILAG